MTTPSDPNAPATQPDTTVGGGGDFTPGSDDPAYNPGPGTGGAPATRPDTTTTDAPGGDGPAGSTDTHTHDPALAPPDTTAGNSNVTGPTGDTDTHARDPRQVSDTTVLGGGVGASSTGQAYRDTAPAPEGTERDTAGRAGTVSVNPGSPDAALVGDSSGQNPNAVEPGLTNSAYSVGGTKDTSYIGSPLSGVPANQGTPGQPTAINAVVVAGRQAVTVSWAAPGNAAGNGVNGYVVESNTGGTLLVGKDATSAEFEQGLVGGQTYTFTVYARTANGTGPRSQVSPSVTIPQGQQVADTTRDQGL